MFATARRLGEAVANDPASQRRVRGEGASRMGGLANGYEESPPHPGRCGRIAPIGHKHTADMANAPIHPA